MGSPGCGIKLGRISSSCPALESACEQDDLFLQRFLTWQNLGGGFLQAKQHIPDTQAKVLPHFKSFFQGPGT